MAILSCYRIQRGFLNENHCYLQLRMIIIIPMSSSPQNHPKATIAERERAARPKRVTSRELLGAANDLIIEHGDREYRLRITHNGKLILTA
jgi:hemin uptake protein HemP